jgi:hypothetical protein
MIHQADTVVGIRVPRPVDFQRSRRLAGIGIAQIGPDAAEAVLGELLHCVEGVAVVEAGDRRVQPAARNDQKRES